MKLFKTIAIVGTGLIGGSIALAVKKKKLCGKVIGVARTERTIGLAKKALAMDSCSLDINIIREADLVILAAPVGVILDLSRKISGIIKPDCIVTDVGSTKQEIVARLERIFPGFVGGHPLAGSEKRGVNHASEDIFKGSLCVLTPTKNTQAKALKRISLFWKRLGSRVVFLSPQEHDKALSFVSHLPHIASFSLINTVPERYLRFASSGLRDTTRIAASEASLWSSIFLTNRKNIIIAITQLEENLAKIKSLISGNDRSSLDAVLKRAKHKRESL